MTYKTAMIYFWSGTGNSFRVATRIGELAEEEGLNTRVVSIDAGSPLEEIKEEGETLVGIVFPTHGFTAPWHVLKFAWRLPGSHSTHAFCVATRAGLKFGPVFIPGISGSAAFIIGLLLMLKGFSMRGTMSVDMPSNWFSLHPIQSRKSHAAIIERAEKKIVRFTDKILSVGMVWVSLNNLYEILWGSILSIISVCYLLIGRFFLAKLFFANPDCNGCGVCANHCSVNAIRMSGKANPRPFWKYNCESCMRCAAFCPQNAIEAGHSWGIILYFLTTIPVAAFLFSHLAIYFPAVGSLKGSWVNEIFNLLYFYPAIFISYVIFSALIRISAVHRIFTLTTLTHFPFWKRYREPDTMLKQIAVGKKK